MGRYNPEIHTEVSQEGAFEIIEGVAKVVVSAIAIKAIYNIIRDIRNGTTFAKSSEPRPEPKPAPKPQATTPSESVNNPSSKEPCTVVINGTSEHRDYKNTGRYNPRAAGYHKSENIVDRLDRLVACLSRYTGVTTSDSIDVDLYRLEGSRPVWILHDAKKTADRVKDVGNVLADLDSRAGRLAKRMHYDRDNVLAPEVEQLKCYMGDRLIRELGSKSLFNLTLTKTGNVYTFNHPEYNPTRNERIYIPDPTELVEIISVVALNLKALAKWPKITRVNEAFADSPFIMVHEGYDAVIAGCNQLLDIIEAVIDVSVLKEQ